MYIFLKCDSLVKALVNTAIISSCVLLQEQQIHMEFT